MAVCSSSGNFSGYLFEQITDWRNQSAAGPFSHMTRDNDGLCIALTKRIVTELTYVAILFLGVVEAVFRALIGLALKIASCCSIGNQRNWILQKSDEFSRSAVESLLVSGGTIVGLLHNLVKNRVDPNEMIHIATCGLLA